jgi:hypothetical protein
MITEDKSVGLVGDIVVYSRVCRYTTIEGLLKLSKKRRMDWKGSVLLFNSSIDRFFFFFPILQEFVV